MKKDRFVALAANEVREGRLVIRPFFCEGGTLIINARCNKAGAIRVAMAQDGKPPQPGRRRDDCVPFTGDATAHRMAWTTGTMIPNGWIILHFYIDNADLFTFGITENSEQAGFSSRPGIRKHVATQGWRPYRPCLSILTDPTSRWRNTKGGPGPVTWKPSPANRESFS